MKKGFSLIEIIIALAIAVIVFVAVFHFATSVYVKKTIKNATEKKNFSYSYGEPYCAIDKKIDEIQFSNQNQISFSEFISTSTRISSMHKLVGNTFLFTTDSASTSEHDIFIFDLNFESFLVSLIYSFDVGPGIQDAKLLDRYLYIANTSTNSHIKVFHLDGNEIGRPAFTELSNIKLPTLSASVSLPKKLTIYNNSLILGSEKSNSGPEVFVFPIKPDGNLGELRKTIELDGQVNQAFIGYNDLYIANAADPELRRYDAQFNLNYSYDAPLTLGNGKSVLYMEPYIVLGRTLGTGELSVIEEIGTSTRILDVKRTNGTVDYLYGFNNINFLAITANETQELQFWNIENKFGEAELVHQKNINIPGRVTSYTCSEKSMYMSTFINNQPILIWLEL